MHKRSPFMMSSWVRGGFVALLLAVLWLLVVWSL